MCFAVKIFALIVFYHSFLYAKKRIMSKKLSVQEYEELSEAVPGLMPHGAALAPHFFAILLGIKSCWQKFFKIIKIIHRIAK